MAKSQPPYHDSIIMYQANYKKDLYSIIKKDTAYVKFYAIDSAYKVTASVEKLHDQAFFPMATSNSSSHSAIKFARVKFNLHGKQYTLFAYQLSFLLNSAKHKNDFFIPFTDSTSGMESYGGGRYIDFAIKDIQPSNTLVIDFNKAYNPYCAFTSGYSCPIPPKENDLEVAIRAGEMNFGKKVKH